MSLKRILISFLAAAGLGAGHTASVSAQQNEIRQNAVANGGQQTTKTLEDDVFGRFAGAMRRHAERDYGHTPKEWGMSRACARMVRKNRLRSLGVAGSRI
jgi:hypothetical protein